LRTSFCNLQTGTRVRQAVGPVCICSSNAGLIRAVLVIAIHSQMPLPEQDPLSNRFARSGGARRGDGNASVGPFKSDDWFQSLTTSSPWACTLEAVPVPRLYLKGAAPAFLRH
jgi:hypothetical protein